MHYVLDFVSMKIEGALHNHFLSLSLSITAPFYVFCKAAAPRISKMLSTAELRSSEASFLYYIFTSFTSKFWRCFFRVHRIC